MINISDRLTAKTMEGIVADSHQIQYEDGKKTQRGDTVADKISELRENMSTVQNGLDGYVSFQQQEKTDSEKQTARENIGAAQDTVLDDLKESMESMEKAAANALWELKNASYTKTESDSKYVTTGTSYTKKESDAKYALSGASYTKAESDAKYVTTGTSYTKTESDAKYALSGTSYTKEESDAKYAVTGTSYTKNESDAKYALSGASYTKEESDAKYALSEDVYNREYMDERFNVISAGLNDLDSRCGNFATKSDVPYKFVKMSQSDYDSLQTKDENTIYIII